jgi:hypothetical protein
MDHQLTCTCGKIIRVSRSQAGQELTCDCGQTLQVPTLRGFAQLPLADSQAAAGSSSERKAWGGWRGTILAVACALFVISALPCAYFLFIRSQIDTSYTMQDEIEAGNANYDLMGIEMLVAEWTSFERSGLGPKNKPPFYWMKVVARENEILAAVTGTIAAIAAATATGAWITAPKTKG